MIDDLQAVKKWNTIDKQHQKLLLKNVFCIKCGVSVIIDYNILDDKYGIVLEGKCKKCGIKVARCIEMT